MPGAPSDKFTDDKKTAYLENLRNGMRRGAAAEAVGICRQTARRHYNENPEFRAAVEQAELEACEIVEDALFNTAKGGNVTAQQVWLYNRSKDRWKDQRNVKITVADDDIDSQIDRELAGLVNRGQTADVGPSASTNGHP